MEARLREDGQWIDNCIACDHCCGLEKNSFECNHPKTGHHRYDELHMNEVGQIPFPEWCPLFFKRLSKEEEGKRYRTDIL